MQADNNTKLDFDDSYFQSRFSNREKRFRQQQLDFEFVRANYIKSSNPVIVDFGCAEGDFLQFFKPISTNLYGIEPNSTAAKIATGNGVKILTNLNELKEIDIFILRGVFQHLPNPTDLLIEITEKLNPTGSVCILASPNQESKIYQKFQNLPALDLGTKFNSHYLIPGANQICAYLKNLGFKVIIEYPYWNTPYAMPILDLPAVNLGYVIGKFVRRPYPKNMFNLVATKV